MVLYFNALDYSAKILHENIGGILIPFEGKFLEEFESRFVAIIGSNELHNLTYYLFKKAGKPNMYIHFDKHDDIRLTAASESYGNQITHANFVGHILKEGFSVGFYGTDYWPYEMVIFGKKVRANLRNNLLIYEPDNMYFFDRDYYLWAPIQLCKSVDKHGMERFILKCLSSDKITDIFVNEKLSINIRGTEKFSCSDVNLIGVNLDKIEKALFYDLNPGIIIHWRKSETHEFKRINAYVSIDLDVLEPESNGFEPLVTQISEMLIDSLCKSIRQICSVFDVVAGDICGIVVPSECSEEELDRGVKLILKALGVLIELCKAK